MLAVGENNTCYNTDNQWDAFYTLHENGMYFDRHWLYAIFPELFPIPPHYDGMASDKMITETFVCSMCGSVSKIQNCILSGEMMPKYQKNAYFDVGHFVKCPNCPYSVAYKSKFNVNQTGSSRTNNGNDSENNDNKPILKDKSGNSFFKTRDIEMDNLKALHSSLEKSLTVLLSLDEKAQKKNQNEIGKLKKKLRAVEKSLEKGTKHVVVPFAFTNIIGAAPNQSQIDEHYKVQLTYVLDCGCGVGNTAFPLLEKNAYVKIRGFDFSQKSIGVLRNRDRYLQCPRDIYSTGVWDVTKPFEDESVRLFDGCTQLDDGDAVKKFDYAILLFVLSAIPSVDLIKQALYNIKTTLKDNGVLLFYDYAQGDYCEESFTKMTDQTKPLETELGVRYFRPNEQTVALFFNQSKLKSIVEEIGFSVVESLVREKQEQNAATKEVWTKKFILMKMKKQN